MPQPTASGMHPIRPLGPVLHTPRRPALNSLLYAALGMAALVLVIKGTPTLGPKSNAGLVRRGLSGNTTIPRRRIVISVETGHFFENYERDVPCSVPCEFRRRSPNASAKWYHLCVDAAKITKDHPMQPAILMSMESAANFRCLEDASYLGRFEFFATYRLDSHVPVCPRAVSSRRLTGDA